MFLGLVLAGSLVACGDDEGSVSADPTPVETVTETVTPTPTLTPTPSVEPSEEASATAPTEEASSEAPPVDLTVVPQTYDEAMAHFAALAAPPVSLRAFLTDTDIFCVLDDKSMPAACELGQQDGVEAPDVCGEALVTKVGRLEFRGGKVKAVCNTDTIRGDMPDALAPGEAAQAGDVQCLNALDGVICVSLSSSQGFFAGAGQYVIFPS